MEFYAGIIVVLLIIIVMILWNISDRLAHQGAKIDLSPDEIEEISELAVKNFRRRHKEQPVGERE